MADARPPVEPVLHPTEDVAAALDRGDVHCDAVRQTLAHLGINEQWSWFYSISDLAELFSISRPTVYRTLGRHAATAAAAA